MVNSYPGAADEILQRQNFENLTLNKLVVIKKGNLDPEINHSKIQVKTSCSRKGMEIKT